MELLAVRLSRGILMVNMTNDFIQATWTFLSHWPSACLPVPFSYSMLRESTYNKHSKYPVVFPVVLRWPLIGDMNMHFNLWSQGKLTLNRILFPGHQVAPHDNVDINISKSNLNGNTSAHAHVPIVDKDLADKIPTSVSIFMWVFWGTACQFWFVLCIEGLRNTNPLEETGVRRFSWEKDWPQSLSSASLPRWLGIRVSYGLGLALALPPASSDHSRWYFWFEKIWICQTLYKKL